MRDRTYIRLATTSSGGYFADGLHWSARTLQWRPVDDTQAERHVLPRIPTHGSQGDSRLCAYMHAVFTVLQYVYHHQLSRLVRTSDFVVVDTVFMCRQVVDVVPTETHVVIASSCSSHRKQIGRDLAALTSGYFIFAYKCWLLYTASCTSSWYMNVENHRAL